MYLLVWHVICAYMLVFCLYCATSGFGCKKYKQNTSIWSNMTHIHTHTDLTYDMNTSRYCSLYLLVYASMCLYLLIFACIWWKNIFFQKMTYRHIQQCMYLLVWCIYVICVCIQYVFLCIGLYVSVSVCMCIYPSVWACICLYHMQHPSHVHNYTWHFFYHKYHIRSHISTYMYGFIQTQISY